MFHVIFSDQLWSEDLISRFPCVVRHGITLPFDQVLKSPFLTEVTVICNFFDFELFEVVHEVRGRSCKVVPMLRSLAIRSQQGGMEDVMNGPGWRKF